MTVNESASKEKSYQNTSPRVAGFGAKSPKRFGKMRVLETFPRFLRSPTPRNFWFVEVSYLDGPTEKPMLLPVKKSFPTTKRESLAQSCAARGHRTFSVTITIRFLFDAVWDTDFRRETFPTHVGSTTRPADEMEIWSARSVPRVGAVTTVLPSNVLRGEQSNSSMLFADKFFLKLYRKTGGRAVKPPTSRVTPIPDRASAIR